MIFENSLTIECNLTEFSNSGAFPQLFELSCDYSFVNE